MEHVPYDGGEVFAVLKDKNSNKKFLARFKLDGKQVYYGEIKGDGIEQADMFAVHPELGYLFYASGSSIYQFDSTLGETFFMHDYQGREISAIKFQAFFHVRAVNFDNANTPMYNDYAKRLLVGSYVKGDAEKSGQFDLFEVPEINGRIKLKTSYTGLGKISKIAYRER